MEASASSIVTGLQKDDVSYEIYNVFFNPNACNFQFFPCNSVTAL